MQIIPVGDSNNLPESLRNPDYNIKIEHGRFVPGIRRTYKALNDDSERGPGLPVASLSGAYDIDGPCPLCQMTAPPSSDPVLVIEPVLNPFQIDIPEMEQIEMFPDMEIMPFYTMKT